MFRTQFHIISSRISSREDRESTLVSVSSSLNVSIHGSIVICLCCCFHSFVAALFIPEMKFNRSTRTKNRMKRNVNSIFPLYHTKEKESVKKNETNENVGAERNFAIEQHWIQCNKHYHNDKSNLFGSNYIMCVYMPAHVCIYCSGFVICCSFSLPLSSTSHEIVFFSELSLRMREKGRNRMIYTERTKRNKIWNMNKKKN